jgi:hypothetical protein
MENIVTVTHKNRGSGGIFTITGTDAEAVKHRTEIERSNLDFMSSPRVLDYGFNEHGVYKMEVTYYGLD